MKIVLCDDDRLFLDELCKNVERICEDLKEKPVTLIPFYSGEEFLKFYEGTKDIDIILLDILMKDINGVEVARKIRNTDLNMQILFLTSIKNYVFEGYSLNAVNYLLKPIKYNILKNEMKKAIENVNNLPRAYFVEKNDNGVYKIYISEIIYIETYMRNTQIHINNNEVILSYKSMKAHLAQLENADFYMIHESFIVNLRYIRKVVGYDVILLDGKTLPVSKSRKKAFMERMSRYYGKMV